MKNKQEVLQELTSNNFVVTEQFLARHPNCFFVYGDNTLHLGTAGAAALRHCSNTYGFVTKKIPSNKPQSFYTQEEYKHVFTDEVCKLHRFMTSSPASSLFLVSKLGAGLANKYGIWESIIEPWWNTLPSFYPQVILLH